LLTRWCVLGGSRPTLWLLYIVLALGQASVAGGATDKARELHELREQIRSIQRNLETNQAQKSRAQARLRDIERRISTASRRLRRTDADLKANRDQLDALQERREDQKQLLQTQQKLLATEARAAYAMGRQQRVKTFLNQENPSAIGRTLVYFQYFSRARAEQIDAVRGALLELQELERSIEEKAQALQALRAQQEQEAARLEQQKRLRGKAVAALDSELSAQGSKLKQLKTDERQLQALLSSLQRVLPEPAAGLRGDQPFRMAKGKLPWPVAGEVAQGYGSRRGNTGLTWRGVLIEAPEGGSVRAVFRGQVVFADWMRGFGLLLIVDHGDGFMSLYGHNQALYKEVGDRVDTGEAIALLGASGGHAVPGLYFELRHKGRPINPASWCAGQPARAPG
jgi:septal ring factor EnvC (AmiA/AmiB activator)